MLQDQLLELDILSKNPTSPWTATMAKLHDRPSPTTKTWDGLNSGDKTLEDGSRALPQETAIAAPRRHRLNSHKNPKENESRQEFATLAVVFGREEYIEPKPLWERQDEQGHVEIKDRSVVSSSYIRSSASDVQSISQIVNSSFSDVSEELMQRPTFNNSQSDSTLPIFSLPPIPQIASFPEYLDDDSAQVPDLTQSFDRLSPSLSDPHRRSFSPKQNYEPSYDPSIRTSFYEEDDVAPPLLFLDYPPAIFDALVSDLDERIIIWGADSNKSGPKPATPANNPPPSTVKGFSANVTTPQIDAPASHGLRRKISRNLTTSAIRTSIRRTTRQSQSLLMQLAHHSERSSSSMDYHGSSDSSERSDDVQSISNQQPSTDSMVIEAATVEKLVEKLTSILDYGFLTDFFLTYRTFISPLQLCKLLILRFRWSFINDDEERRVVRIRTFVVLRHWLLNYFVHDFIPSRQLRVTLTFFINQLAFHPLVRQSVRDQRIVKGLKRVVRRLKLVYYRKAESGHVRIISPPPVTPEQEQIEKMVRGKLLQNPMRRTAAASLGGKFKWSGAKMNGNTAISDANLASVVVIGNLHGKGASTTNLVADSGKKIFGSMRAISMTDIRSSVLSSPTRRFKDQEENVKFVPIKTLQMQRRAEIERQQSEAEREYERQRKMEGRPLSIASDDSLESELTAGTTDNELDQHSDADDSLMEKDKNFEEEELAARELEIQRRKLEEEEEMSRVEFYAQGDIPPTPKDENNIPKSLDIFSNSHANTIHLDRMRTVDVRDDKSSTASADAVMVTARKPNKRPGLPFEFLPATSQPSDNTNAIPLQNINVHDSKLGNTADIAQSIIDRPKASPLQGTFPSGLAKELSQKSIERRQSERDLRKLYLKSDQDVAPVPDLPPSVPKLDHVDAEDKASQVEDFQQKLRKTPSGQFVNMIAQELRREDPEGCNCDACRGVTDDTTNCKRLSKLLTTDIDRRHSIELRHRRGASVDRLSEATKDSTVGYEVIHFHGNSQASESNAPGDADQRSSAVKAASAGLSSEAADTIASLPYVERSNIPLPKDIDLLRLPDRRPAQTDTVDLRYAQLGPSSILGLERMPSVVSALRTVQLEKQHSDIYSEVAELAIATSSVGGGQDSMSEPNGAPAPEKITNRGHQKQSERPARNSVLTSVSSQPEESIPRSVPEAKPYWRRSFILYERSELIAQQLCLVERDVLLAVQWEELVHCRWTKMTEAQDNVEGTEGQNQGSRFDSSLQHGVQDVIQRFNVVCQWVASEIVRTPNIDERVRTIEKFIRIAQKCRMYSNFATLIQVLLGLQAPAVTRLHKTWSKVRNTELKTLDELSSFTSPTKNWKHMRDNMTVVAEEYGMSSTDIQIEMPGTSTLRGFTLNAKGRVKIPFGGCIPFLGIYLSDLVFNSEQPAYIESQWEKADTNRIYRQLARSNQEDISPLLKQPLVNFGKHRVTATIIKRVLTFQNLARRYPFEPHPDLFIQCCELDCLSPETIKALSQVIERSKE